MANRGHWGGTDVDVQVLRSDTEVVGVEGDGALAALTIEIQVRGAAQNTKVTVLLAFLWIRMS